MKFLLSSAAIVPKYYIVSLCGLHFEKKAIESSMLFWMRESSLWTAEKYSLKSSLVPLNSVQCAAMRCLQSNTGFPERVTVFGVLGSIVLLVQEFFCPLWVSVSGVHRGQTCWVKISPPWELTSLPFFFYSLTVLEFLKVVCLTNPLSSFYWVVSLEVALYTFWKKCSVLHDIVAT